MNMTLERIKRWGVKGGLSILDQGLFSGTNFIVSILLARWLPASSYGAFSFVFAIYLFTTGFHSALILEPMSVLGPSKYKGEMPVYLTALFALHFLLTVPLGLITMFAGGLLHVSNVELLGNALFGAGVALPFLLLVWLVRRVCYIKHAPQHAVFLSAFYAIFALGGFFLLRLPISNNLMLGFVWLGLSSLLSSLLSIRLAHNEIFDVFKASGLKRIFNEHWLLGKWLFLSNILDYLAFQSQVFVVTAFMSFSDVASWKALHNFYLPIRQTSIALSTMTLPYLAADYGKTNLKTLKRKGKLILAALSLLSISYFLFLLFFHDPLERLLYAGKYEHVAWLIPSVGFVAILTTFVDGFTVMNRAVQKFRYYVIVMGGSAFVGVFVGPFLVYWFGIIGAVGTMGFAMLIAMLISFAYFLKYFRQ
jgi:O-antigen/teichoic acid export membrane protein